MACATPKGWPAEITIVGQRWQVLYSPNLASTKGALGLTDASQRTIILDLNQAEESLKDVLWHEVLHACINMGPAWNLDERLEESLVRQLTPAILGVLRSVKPWW